MESALRLRIGIAGLAIAATIAGAQGFANEHWLKSARFGAGQWTWSELNELQRNNYRPDAAEICGVKNQAGGIDFPDNPECLYKDPILGKQLEAGIMEANAAIRKEDPVASAEDIRIAKTRGIHTWEGMSEEQLQTAIRLKNGEERIASRGTPTTFHGKEAKWIDSHIEGMNQLMECEGSLMIKGSELHSEMHGCEPPKNPNYQIDEDSVTFTTDDGSFVSKFDRSNNGTSGKFTQESIFNQGDIYNIENQDNGEVNFNAIGSDMNTEN